MSVVVPEVSLHDCEVGIQYAPSDNGESTSYSAQRHHCGGDGEHARGEDDCCEVNEMCIESLVLATTYF